jgi:hypothetical protein
MYFHKRIFFTMPALHQKLWEFKPRFKTSDPFNVVCSKSPRNKSIQEWGKSVAWLSGRVQGRGTLAFGHVVAGFFGAGFEGLNII